VELLASALARNTVVCMGSSSGRMFIAVMLLKEMASQLRVPVVDGGRRSIFLVDSEEMLDEVRLRLQHPCDFPVTCARSSDMDTIAWKKQLDCSGAIILTGSVFLQLLKRGVATFVDLNLVIFHNCHKVLEASHPYQHIMDLYRDCPVTSQPRLLGLAPNILDGKYQTPKQLADLIASLEKALCSVAETTSLVIPERYGIKPREEVIECADYEDKTGLKGELCELLEGSIDFLDECNIQINEELDKRDPRQIPKAALIECYNILFHLGPWCAQCLANMLVNQLEKIEKQKEFIAMNKKFLKIGATTLRMVSKIFDEHFKKCDYSLEELLKYSTPKVAALLEHLRKYRPKTDFVIISEELDDMDGENDSNSDMSDDSYFSDNDVDDDDDDFKSPSSRHIHVAVKKVNPGQTGNTDTLTFDEDTALCGLIFVDNQYSAYALNKFIEEACSWDEGLCFVKSSHLTGNKSMSKGLKLYKKQEDTLRKFRMQELNLLISTSVLEEGVDVPKCNFVARFEIPRSYRSYSHSKGRARAREAEFLIFIEEEHSDAFESELKTYRDIEKVLAHRQCEVAEEGVEVPSESTQCDSHIKPFFPQTGDSKICASEDNAIMLVNRYCAKLPSDAFTHLTPRCNIHKVKEGDSTLYVAMLRLPINSPIKQEIQGTPMPTVRKAKQAVAVEACEILFQQGELDVNLMPVGKEMLEGEGEAEEEEEVEEEEDFPGEARPGTTKRKQYYCKRTATALQQTLPEAGVPSHLYVVTMVLTGPITEDQNTRGRKIYAPEETTRSFGIITAKPIPLVPMFPVFTRSGEVTVSVDLLTSRLHLCPKELTKLQTFHQFIFSNVLRLEKEPMDYIPSASPVGYLVVPLNREDPTDDLGIDWNFTDRVVNSKPNRSPTQNEEYTFEFKAEDFEDAVVMPAYRNIDQPQYFYVAEIRFDLNPCSPFPSPELYKTFAEYYAAKYGLAISNLDQPLLDVDHTSARLNLLIPRYMNQKGVPLPTTSAETKKARRENLQQKQILVPELCDVHVFLASLWRKAVCLPAILYRLNYLLLAEEIRKLVAKETKIGIEELPSGFRFTKLDFGIDTSPENLRNVKEEKETESVVNTAETIAINEDMLEDTCEKDRICSDEGSSMVNSNDGKISENEFHEKELDTGKPLGEKFIEHISCPSSEKENMQKSRIDKVTVENLSKNVNRLTIKDISDNLCNSECDPCVPKQLKNKNVTQKRPDSKDKYILSNGNCVDEESHRPCMMNGQDSNNSNLFEQTSYCNGVREESTTEPRDNIKDEGFVNHKKDIQQMDGHQDLSTDVQSRLDNKSTENGKHPTIEDCNHSKKSLDTEKDYDVFHNVGAFRTEEEKLQAVANSKEKNKDVFENVGVFMTEEEKQQAVANSNECPEPLISLDQDMDLSTFIGPSPCEILQALTMSNANDFFSLERLETIGDSFLKYAITVYLYCSYPGIHEGKLSYLRSKQVSNYNLYRLGKRKGLAECMISTKFEPYENWLPPGYVINDDKRKGPVPKVFVNPVSTYLSNCVSVSDTYTTNTANDTSSNNSNNIADFVYRDKDKFQSELKEADQILEVKDEEFEKGQILSKDKFQSELEEADQIAKAKDEEFEKDELSAESSQYMLPYCLQLHHCLPDKSIADGVEALIGCYLTSCDKMAALRFMAWMGLKVLPKERLKWNTEHGGSPPDSRVLPCPKSPLVNQNPESKELLSRLLHGYERFEATIGYTFNDRSYLLQAFTHASYHYNIITDCYQRLEFLGDAVLDYVITRHLYEDSDRYSPGVLTDLRSALVNNNIFAALAVKWDFHKYFKAISPSLFSVIEKFVLRQKEKEDEIDEDADDELDEDHDKEHVELEVPKALGDIFESVAGAIYLDSGMSLEAVWRVFYRIMKPQIDKYLKNIPKSPVRELLEQEPETAKFEKPERTMDGKIRVTVNVVGKGVYTGVGRNYRIAKSAAAKKALRCIKTLELQGLI
ncbi:hypothetical protein DPMN_088351, partial [Dreissena polymorpha]